MKILSVICNVLFWAFFCFVIITDGPPQGAGILLASAIFVMPLFNVLVIRILASPSHNLQLAAIILNILWLGVSGWLIIDKYPAHPAEEGLFEYVTLMTLTPLVSGVALFIRMRKPEPLAAK
jgi:hypothetical protein